MEVTKLGVHIKVRDINKSLQFYKNIGFAEVFAYGSEIFLSHFRNISTAPENYNGVVFDLNGGVVEIADGHLAVKPEVFHEVVTSSKLSLMFDVESVEEIQKIAKANNMSIAAPIRTFHWGTKEIVLKDPDGVILVFREKVKI